MNLSKKLIVLTAVVCLAIFIASIVSAQTQTLSFQGTVKYLNLEGGFWGIVSEDGKNYDPLNLAAEFQQEGLSIQVKAVVKDDMVSIHMWGTIIQITAITKVANVERNDESMDPLGQLNSYG
jgi:hypothetical protein